MPSPRTVRTLDRTMALLGCALAALASGCAGPAGARATYTDPFAYCSAVGTVDAPDARYTGAAVPPAIVQGIRKAFDAPPDAPSELFTRGTSWRCMDGKVYACNVGANLPCSGKADLDRTPALPLVEFCRQNPSADVAPMVVTGRDTVYEWKCASGAPVIVRQVAFPDARGFIRDIWYPIAPSS